MARKVIAEFDAIDGPFINKLNAIDRSVTRFEVGTLSAFGRVEKGVNGLLASAARLQNVSGIIAGGFGAGMATQFVDQATRIRRALKEAGDESQEGFEKAFLASQRSLSGFEAFAQGVQRAKKATGGTFDEAIRDMETLNKLLVLGGKTTQERMSTNIQFSQALQAGVLQGEELRSLRENAPIELIRAIAREAGGTIEDLKKFGQAGVLTTEVMIRALRSLEKEADLRLKSVTLTISEAATLLANAGIVAVEGFDKGLGLSRVAVSSLTALAEVLGSNAEAAENFGKAVQTAGGLLVASFAGRRVSDAIAGQAAFAKSLKDTAAAAAVAERASAATLVKSQARVQALRAEVAALIQKGAAEKTIASAQSRLASAQSGLTAATARHTAAVRAATLANERLTLSSRAVAAAGNLMRGAWAFLGGWPGLILTAGTAFLMLSSSAESAADRFERLTSETGTATGAADALRDVQTRLNEAINEAGIASDSSSKKIIANTRAELLAKRDLLKLENQRLKTLQAEREAEVSRLGSEIDNTYAGAQSQVDAMQLSGVVDPEQVAQAFAAADAIAAGLRDKIVELRANMVLTGIAIEDNNALLSDTATKVAAVGTAGAEMRMGMQQNASYTEEAIAEYEKLLAKKQAEIGLQELINQYGAESAQVAKFRADAEREAYEELAKSKGITGELLATLMAAYDEAVALGQADVASGINAAASSAAALARDLGVSLAIAQKMMAAGYSKGPVILDPRDPRYDAGAAARATNFGFEYGRTSPFDPSRNKTKTTGGSSGAKSGSGNDIDREALQFIESMMTAEERRAKQSKELIALREKLVAKYGAEHEMVKQLDQAMERMNETLEEGNTLQDQFWGTMSDYIAQSINEWKGWGNFVKGLLASFVSEYGADFLIALFTPGKQKGSGLGTWLGNALTGDLKAPAGKTTSMASPSIASKAADIGKIRMSIPAGFAAPSGNVTVVNHNDFRGVDGASREYLDGRLKQLERSIPGQAVAAVKSAKRKRMI